MADSSASPKSSFGCSGRPASTILTNSAESLASHHQQYHDTRDHRTIVVSNVPVAEVSHLRKPPGDRSVGVTRSHSKAAAHQMPVSFREKLAVHTLAPRRELLRYLETVFPAIATIQSDPLLADDPALTAFAQLGALRLNTKTCVISLLSRQTQYIIAESTQSQSICSPNSHNVGDGILFGRLSAPIETTICAWGVANANKFRDGPEGIDLSHQPDSTDCFIVPNLTKDDRFSNHPVVTGPPGLRFYAGVPLVSPHTGRGIGSYCVLDNKPRDTLSLADIQAMRDMAATVMSHLEHSRASLEQARSEKMVRGIGAFVEGDSSIQEWWSRTSSGLGKKIPNARATADFFAHASGIGKNSTVGADKLEKESKSNSGPIPSTCESDSGSPADSIDPSGLLAPNLKTKRERGQEAIKAAKTATVKDKEQSAGSSVIKTLVSRASNIIREAAELDGAVFVDARMASLRTGRTISHASGSRVVDDMDSETSPSSNGDDPNRPCRLLGFSANEGNFTDEVNPATSLSLFPERTLRYMLRRYPKGKILNLEDPASASESELSASTTDSVEFEVHKAIDPDGKTRKPVRISRANEAAIMSKTFPGAKSVAFFPLFETSKERWFSAAFAYTCSSLRELTVEGELSYLAAFGNSLMAEVSRADAMKADEAKANFIGAISHELRSPLHGILGSVEMLKDSALDSLQSDLVHNVQVCGKTLLHTVEHLLDFSKMNNLLRPRTAKETQALAEGSTIKNAESLGFNESTLDLGIVCEEVMQTVSSGHNNNDVGSGSTHDAFSESVAIVLDIDDPTASLFRGQPGALKRIISNLISNGQKYTTAGFVRLILETKSLVPAEHDEMDGEDQPNIHITVQDSGKGISKSYMRDRLYTPFAQEDSHAPGTGLGLSIVRQIVRSLRGTINIESEKDIGTSVRISLPMAQFKGSVSHPEREEILAARHAVGNKAVAFIGFDFREGPDLLLAPPTSWSPAARGNAFLGRSLASFCDASLGMTVSRFAYLADVNIAPDACIIDLPTARAWTSEPSFHSIPAIVVCPSAQSAAHWTRVKAGAFSTSPIYYAAQPIGPLRLAKIFKSMFVENQPLSAASNEAWPWDILTPGIAPATSQSDRASGHTGAWPPPLAPATTSAHPARPTLPPTTTNGPTLPPKQAFTDTSLPHVLVVDDNTINLRLLQTFCRKLQLTHVSAANGLEALEAYKAAWVTSRPFEYVLMDINMPIMDGLQSTRQIRHFERDQESRTIRDGTGKTHRSAIIALTGLNSASSQAEAFASGMDMFLTKPVKFAELQRFLLKDGGGDITGLDGAGIGEDNEDVGSAEV